MIDYIIQMNTYFYRVAGFLFSVSLPAKYNIQKLLPSFRAFRCERKEGERLLFAFTSVEELPRMEEPIWKEEAENDFGYTTLMQVKDCYRCQIHFTTKGKVHEMVCSPDFSEVRAVLHWDDRYTDSVLCSMLRIIFSQAILPYEGISLHASVVSCEGKGYLFMGKSGTGKSTHAALWVKNIAGVELLNDDNPVVRYEKGNFIVYGSPWSGKTPCYCNLSCPVGGLVRLRQAPVNQFHPQKDIQALVQILPGCSVIRQSAVLNNALCDTLTKMIERIPVGVLDCLPDAEAAACCHKGLLECERKG